MPYKCIFNKIGSKNLLGCILVINQSQMKKKLTTLLFSIAAIGSCFAQNKPLGNAKPKWQPPVIYTYLGMAKDSVGLPAETVKELVRQPLKFVDAKNNTYTLSTYMLVYKRIVTSLTEDEKQILTNTKTGAVFNQSPLPKIWLQTLDLDLKKGEELLFTDVIVKATNGNLYYAKNLKITVL